MKIKLPHSNEDSIFILIKIHFKKRKITFHKCTFVGNRSWEQLSKERVKLTIKGMYQIDHKDYKSELVKSH